MVEGTQGADRYTVSRSQPHHVSKRAVASKHAMYVAASERGVESVPVPADRRNEPVLTDDRLDALVRVALHIERHMRGPQDVEWALEADGTVTVLQARPLRVEAQRPLRGEALATTLARYRVLMRDQGEVACRRVGSGRVVIAAPDGRADGFEPGDVLVARYASPRLSALVSSASAVVTDVGAVTGHMATVAREYRVPTIVGSGQATQFLEAGTVVTVDADDHAIYEGAVQELLRYELLHGRAYQETHQFRVLRRVLNLVAPLSLGIPDGPDFVPERCRTYHDIVRFAHERALGELLHLGAGRISRRRQSTRRLDLDIPLDLGLVDIGGGVAPGQEGDPISRTRITSRPLDLLLEGLTTPGAWSTIQPIWISTGSWPARLAASLCPCPRAARRRGMRPSCLRTT